ncbi:MAG: SDR family oxidoreductase [Bacteroidetes bacterium]|nr:MAG: SDR family oxidoreductase [Bacteroidota bacterium]
MSKKTILVIGASRGIGAELVKILAKNSEHHIIACSRNLERMQENFAGLENVYPHALDLSSETVKSDLKQILSSVSQIDFMVNNAGLLINKPFESLTRSDIETSYAVNVISVMECVQAALPYMKNAHIVNISSMGGFQGSVKFPGLAAYSTSKAAVCSFTELFAEEYKDSKLTMNCLCLGAVQTEMLEEAFPGYEAPMGPDKMGEYIANFLLTGHNWMRGKIIPLSLSTP